MILAQIINVDMTYMYVHIKNSIIRATKTFDTPTFCQKVGISNIMH